MPTEGQAPTRIPHARSLSLELPSPGSRLGRGGGLFFCCRNKKNITLCNDSPSLIDELDLQVPRYLSHADCHGIRKMSVGHTALRS